MSEIPPERAVPDGHEFALCLTHDVDRPYKTYQSLYYAAAERDPSHLASLLPGRNPYWQFESVMALEDDLGVRSAWYFLDEQHLRDRPVREWLQPANWRRYLGRYSLDDPAIRGVMRLLDRGGWEVGLHGSFESYRDPARIRAEKAAVEEALDPGSDDTGDPDADGTGDRRVVGGRQHYLNLDVPDTWRYQAAAGLDYDASLGDADEYGFRYGYGLRRPFDDGFVVFPLTAMERAFPDPGRDFAAAREAATDLLAEAREHAGVATVLWHPRTFAESEFPGYRRLYRLLVEEALAMDAWVGPPADLYQRLDHPADAGREDGREADPARWDDDSVGRSSGLAGNGTAAENVADDDAADDAPTDDRRVGITKADGGEVSTE